LLVWAVSHRRWGALFGLASALLAAAGVAWLIDRDVFNQYTTLMSESPPALFRSTTFGTWLRLIFGWDHFWLQYLPPIVGLARFTATLLQHRTNWNWADRLPAIILISVLTAAYGSWTFDLVVALPAVIQVAADLARRDRPRALKPYLAANLLAMICWFGLL